MEEDRSPKTGSAVPGWAILILGGVVALAGPSCGAVYLFSGLIRRSNYDADTLLTLTTFAGGVVVLGLSFGALLIWQGVQMVGRKPSRPFAPAVSFWYILPFLAVLLVGQLIVSFNLLAALTLPLFHVLGILLPALGILALIGRALSGSGTQSTWRQVALQSTWGGLAAVAISFAAEVGAVLFLAAVGALFLAATEGTGKLGEVLSLLEQPGWADDPGNLAKAFSSPLLLGAFMLLLAVIVPLVEETCKGLGVILMGLWQKPTPAQGWLWGIASGAGFALSEGIFNGAMALQFWAAIALLRLGTTLMHCTTAGLFGLGLSGSLRTRRPWPALETYAIGVSLHGIWNGLTVFLVVTSLGVTTSEQTDAAFTALGGGVALFTLGAFACILLSLVVLLVYETRLLRKRAAAETVF